MVKVLVMGGTRFNGLALVRELVKHGRDVTVLNRGHSEVELPRAVRRLYADRTNKQQLTEVLGSEDFDVVQTEYGRQKLRCEAYLFQEYRTNGFPATSVPFSMVLAVPGPRAPWPAEPDGAAQVRGLLLEHDTEEFGRVSQPGPTMRLSRTPLRPGALPTNWE